MTKTITKTTIFASILAVTLATGLLASSDPFVNVATAQTVGGCPGITVMMGDLEFGIDSYTKSKTKDGTTVSMTKPIDEDSPKIEELLDSGDKIPEVHIMKCTFDPSTGDELTWHTIWLEEVEITSISQSEADDNESGTETITMTAKKSKSEFERHGGTD